MRLAQYKHCRWHQTWAVGVASTVSKGQAFGGTNLHQVTVAHGWCCQDWKPGLLDSTLHPAIFPPHQAGPDFSSDKSLAITAKKPS